jgi:hypothetical protein
MDCSLAFFHGHARFRRIPSRFEFQRRGPPAHSVAGAQNCAPEVVHAIPSRRPDAAVHAVRTIDPLSRAQRRLRPSSFAAIDNFPPGASRLNMPRSPRPEPHQPQPRGATTHSDPGAEHVPPSLPPVAVRRQGRSIPFTCLNTNRTTYFTTFDSKEVKGTLGRAEHG